MSCDQASVHDHDVTRPLPDRIETERLILRRYSADDVAWFDTMALRNRQHLARYESDNFVLSVNSPELAAIILQELIDCWDERSTFFLGAFLKPAPSGEQDLVSSTKAGAGVPMFVAQIYIGPVNWDLPELEVGYFVDVAHEGHGYVTEALRATLDWIFAHLGAHRIRLECDDTNHRSAAVAERCGFTREAHLRENKLNPDGSITGTYIYGLLRREYPGTGDTPEP
jgi:RimJ/RimL family protein N-acetyltransferase